MQRIKRLFSKRLVSIAIAFLLTGCPGPYVQLQKEIPDSYERLGKAQGRSCGVLLIGNIPLSFIPIGMTGRLQKAHSAAIESVPGATALIEVQQRESWFWFVLGTQYCTTITAEAIR